METKNFLLSKTLWINAAIAGGSAAWQVITGSFPAEIVAVATPLLNILLRLVTKSKLTLS